MNESAIHNTGLSDAVGAVAVFPLLWVLHMFGSSHIGKEVMSCSRAAFSWPPHPWEGTIVDQHSIKRHNQISERGFFGCSEVIFILCVGTAPFFPALVGGSLREQSTGGYTRTFYQFTYRLIYVINAFI